MIIFYHNKYRITEIFSTAEGHPNKSNEKITAVLLDFADKFKDELLVWCHQSEKGNLNVDVIESLFHHKKLLYSYNPSQNYFASRLGYIEDSPYIHINKEVRFGTWQMSSHVGAVHASVLNACKNDLKAEFNFDYFLNSFARRACTKGLLCYSEPKLLLHKNSVRQVNPSLFEFFKFTRHHYRMRWIFLLFFNLAIYERKFPIFPFMFSLLYKKRNFNTDQLNNISLESNKKIIESGTIDVLIPTIGRRDYLLDVLNNLESQTHLPKNVIIIEQNPVPGSESDLDFIYNKKWSFNIKHEFIHRSGACNARNIGLRLVESEFTFFADDDIVIENNLLESAIKIFQDTGNEVFLVACHLKSQSILTEVPRQFPVFGAGHAFLKTTCFKELKFNMAFEFGFGEDNDFGMQLRNKGFDILYISTSQILHLKAPMGGFRTKPVLRWHEDEIQPKPSPTVMLFRLLYDTDEQLRGYKTVIFLKGLDKSFFKSPFKRIRTFRQKWDRSIYWANELKKQ